MEAGRVKFAPDVFTARRRPAKIGEVVLREE
jgi:hypothetical protein